MGDVLSVMYIFLSLAPRVCQHKDLQGADKGSLGIQGLSGKEGGYIRKLCGNEEQF